MAVLTPGGADAPPPSDGRPGTGRSTHGAGRRAPVPPGSGPARQRVLLVSRDDELDSLLARRRVAAHLGGLAVTTEASAGGPPDAALVCDDEAATERLLALGVPVVHLFSGEPSGERGAGRPGAVGRAVRWLHRPGWLPAPGPPGPGVRATGTLAPVRTARDRGRAGALLLLSLWGVPDGEARAFADGPLQALVRAAADRAGHCDVVCDTGLAAVRSALRGLGASGEVRSSRAADVDVDALHAAGEVFLASPTLAAVGLARARIAPVCFLPPLGEAQRALAERVRRVVSVPVADGSGRSPLPEPPRADALWSAVESTADDLRGAQRIARSVRQLSLAPP
ncbi:CGA synthase-related protein [Streptomyces sp. SCA3-4]|uniref:CGA synthase-related protein n=1 Tax=Streptomyces sichuanensis TaxID=2871810 RepID=UPI001CE25E7C|nr:CGA synthase-related protein [Streptomyces sichuanensis]MCA6091277.1 CGA synthase-related protein [Streptomyces sichuanensis]